MHSVEAGMEREDLTSRRVNCEISHTSTSVETDGRKLTSQTSNWSYEMCDEVKRMYTFAHFPHKGIILKLHASGYFYSGNDDTTICHKCHAGVNGWKHDDDPRKFHELNCNYRNSVDHKETPYLENASASLLDEPIQDVNGSVPLSPTILSTSNEISNPPGIAGESLHLTPSSVEVSVESNASERGQIFPQGSGILHSFANAATSMHRESKMHSNVNLPQRVDNYRFPTQVSDAYVELAYPDEAHSSSTLRHSSNQGQIQLPNIGVEGGAVEPTAFFREIEEQVHPVLPDSEWASAFPCDEPEYPDMRNTTHRLESFIAFWTDGIVGNINEIASAGFYCFGTNRTRCWYCGCGGHKWRPNENPWEIHAAIYPNCEFLLQQKGADYVSDVCGRGLQRPASPWSLPPPLSPSAPESPRLRRMSFSSNSSGDSLLSSTGSSDMRAQNLRSIAFLGGNEIRRWDQYRRETKPPRVVDPREEEAERKNLLQTSLNSEIVVAALEMGFELAMIKRVIKRKIWRTKESYSSSATLLDDLLHPPGDMDSESDEDELFANATGNTSGATYEIPESEIRVSGNDDGRPAATVSSAQGMDQKELDEKLREFEHEKRCKVCLDRDADVVFMPCGHLCTCVECAQALRTCPLCRKRIEKSIKTYSS